MRLAHSCSWNSAGRHSCALSNGAVMIFRVSGPYTRSKVSDEAIIVPPYFFERKRDSELARQLGHRPKAIPRASICVPRFCEINVALRCNEKGNFVWEISGDVDPRLILFVCLDTPLKHTFKSRHQRMFK